MDGRGRFERFTLGSEPYPAATDELPPPQLLLRMAEFSSASNDDLRRTIEDSLEVKPGERTSDLKEGDRAEEDRLRLEL